jgi:hypothetical protein
MSTSRVLGSGTGSAYEFDSARSRRSEAEFKEEDHHGERPSHRSGPGRRMRGEPGGQDAHGHHHHHQAPEPEEH